MSGLKIDNADAFARLLSALATDVVYAHIHLTLLLDITRAQEDYGAELAQSRTFWALTTQAHFETGLAKLARAYDSQRNALSLSTWLDTVFENLHLFSADSFRKRLAGNPFVESLADVDRTPDLTQLNRDRAAVAPSTHSFANSSS